MKQLKFWTHLVVVLMIANCAIMKDPGMIANQRYKEEIRNFPLYEKILIRELDKDIDFLIKTIEEVHPNPYLICPKEAFYKKLDTLKTSIENPLTRKEFSLLLRPLIRLLQTDHTSVKLPWEEYNEYKKMDGKLLPFDVSVDDNYIKIKKNYSSLQLKEGDVIESINGINSEVIINDVKKFYGIEEVQRLLHFLLWIKYSFEAPFTVKINHHTYTLNGLAAEEISAKRKQQKDSSSPHVRYRYQNLGEKTGWLVVNSFGGDIRKFDKFLKQSFTQIQQDSIAHLIIDIRNNDGGRTELVNKLVNYVWDKSFKPAARFERKRSTQFDQKIKDVMAGWLTPVLRIHPYMKDYYKTPYGQVAVTVFDDVLPEENPLRFYGDVYVLISPYTYSSAHEFACIIKDYKMGILIGQETGSRKPGSDAYEFILPHSCLWARSATAFSVRPGGITATHGVIPDIEVKPEIEDMNTNIDTVLEFTQQLINKKHIGDAILINESVTKE